GQGRRRRRGARRTHPPRSDDRARPHALPGVRQPAQGRGAERDPDRAARARARHGLMDIGMLGRFFGRHTGGNWRPPAQELAFAAQSGFDTVQIRSDRPGELEDELGIAAQELGALYDELGVEPVLGLLVRHECERGTFARALRASLPAIEAAGFLRVHVHPVGPAEAAPFLRDDLAEALALAGEALLEAVPGLGFVWDVNHTPAEHVERFLALRERFTLVHVSDTPLPETNHHLPLGRGS